MISPLTFTQCHVYNIETKKIRVIRPVKIFDEHETHIRIFLKSGTSNVIQKIEYSAEVGKVDFKTRWLMIHNHIIWKNLNGMRQIVQVSDKRYVCYISNIHLFCKPLSNLNDMLDFLDM